MLLSYVLPALGLMKIFEKAGVPNWYAWIPIFRMFWLVKVASNKIWPFIIYVCGLITIGFVLIYYISTILSIGDSSSISEEFLISFATKILVFLLIYAVLILFFNIFMAIKVSKAYSLSGGFAVLLAIFPVIGYLVVGFGQSQYIGPQ